MNENKFKSDNQLLQEISEKLTQLIAMNGMSGLDKNEQVKYLANFGLSILDISKLTAVPTGTVGRVKAEQKKKKK